MIGPETWLLRLACLACVLVLAGCGFHLRRSAAVPRIMQQRVYLRVNGGGEFARMLAAELRASKVEVVDTSTKGVPTLDVTTAAFSRHELLSTGYQRVGEYTVRFVVNFHLNNAAGKTVIPTQSLTLSHQFAVDQTQLAAISSETGAIERNLAREMTDAVVRRLEAQARKRGLSAPVAASSAG